MGVHPATEGETLYTQQRIIILVTREYEATMDHRLTSSAPIMYCRLASSRKKLIWNSRVTAHNVIFDYLRVAT